MNKSGGFGRYQCFTLLCLILSMNGPGILVYGIAYFQLQPPYICTYRTPPAGASEVPAITEQNQTINPGAENFFSEACSYETVCNSETSDTNLISYEVDNKGEFYINNWIEQANIQCMPQSAIGLAGALAFLGAALGCFFLPVLGDVYGRYNVFMVVSFLQLPLYIANYFAQSIAVLYIVCFFFGLALVGRFTCAFVLLTESLCERHKVLAGTFMLTMDAMATMYVTFYLRFISVNYSTLIIIGFALNLVSFIGNLFSRENPAWLLEVGEIE